MARTATGKNSAKAGAGLTKGNGIDILDKDERLDELYDDPESDVALVSKDGVVFKYYSGMLKKKSKFFTDLFATPYAPAPFVEPENGEMIPDVFSTPARRVVLTFSTDCISTYLGILNSRKSTLPDMSPSAFEEQFDLGALFQHDMLIGRLLAMLSIDARLDAFLAFRLAARHPVVEDKLLRHAFARLQDQTTRGHCAMSYEQYTAAIALRSVFSPLYPGKDTTLKGWEWVQDAAEVENFIKAVHTPTTESAVEGPAKKKAKK